MTQKRKIRYDRLAIIIVSILLIICLLAFIIFELGSFIFKDKGGNNNNKDKEVVTVDTNEDTKLSLISYDVYFDDTNSLGFNFIVAKCKAESSKAVSFDLSYLQSAEKIFLNSVFDKLDALDKAGYNISKLNISKAISSEEKSCEVNIFIPFTTKNSPLMIYNKLDTKNNLEFDLTKNNLFVSTLKLSGGEDIVIGDNSVFVSNSYISTFMKHNGEEYQIGSSMRIYTFEISVNKIDENVRITDATFVEEGKDESGALRAMPSEYDSDMNNILNQTLKVGSKGALFFEAYSEADVAPNGLLVLKLSNSDEWIKINITNE